MSSSVIISFVGQRLWNHPQLMHDLAFTLPLILWVVIAAVVIVTVLRVITSWLQIDEEGFQLRSLFRRTRNVRWDEVGQVIAARDIDRGATAAEMLDVPEAAYDGVYVLNRRGAGCWPSRTASSGPRAQEITLTVPVRRGSRSSTSMRSCPPS